MKANQVLKVSFLLNILAVIGKAFGISSSIDRGSATSSWKDKKAVPPALPSARKPS